MSVIHNTHTKFAKLAVGKHVVTAKQRNAGDHIFPLTVAINGLVPLSKVQVDYLPQPKNTFTFRVNDADIYSLTKEEVDYNPSKTEPLKVDLSLKDKQESNEEPEYTISGETPWIIDEVEEKIQTALGMNHLTSLRIDVLEAKSWVANEFLDVLTCYDLPDHGLDKLTLN